jgi:hypothetical protein
VGKVHIRTDGFYDAADNLEQVLAVMDDEFKIERRDVVAGVAGTGGAALDGKLAITEGKIGAFDQLQQGLPARHFAGRHIGKYCIAFQFGDDKERLETIHDRFKQVGQDLMCVVKLHTRQIRGVA